MSWASDLPVVGDSKVSESCLIAEDFELLLAWKRELRKIGRFHAESCSQLAIWFRDSSTNGGERFKDLICEFFLLADRGDPHDTL